MDEAFIGTILMFAGNFAPENWAYCDGALLAIAQYAALFSILGTTYGGDGKSTFALPNLQGNAPMQQGQGQGLTLRDLGETSGVESVTLLQSEMPVHTHTLQADLADPADTNAVSPSASFATSTGGTLYQNTQNTAMAFQALAVAGGGLPHNNMQPYLTLNYCIALQGVFPQRPVANPGQAPKGTKVKGSSPINIMND